MTIARSHQINAMDTPYYHCIARCVRRAFLCGYDHVTGSNFEHRRQWVVDKLAELSEVFAIDVCAYAVMSNHYHVVLHVDTQQIEHWSNREVIARWGQLFRLPPLVQRHLQDPNTTDAEQAAVETLVTQWRTRLTDISWFMRCLNETIARKANREDRCKGRFWEGRFKSQALLDEAALLTCMAYVDLNPIRAGIANTPESSDFTSIQQRIQTLATTDQSQTTSELTAPPSNAYNLLPFADAQVSADSARCIPFESAHYLMLVDWLGRAIRDDKQGAIPRSTAPILQRVGINPAQWLETVSHFGRRFQRAVGPAERLLSLSQQVGQRWLTGIRSSRQMYLSSG